MNNNPSSIHWQPLNDADTVANEACQRIIISAKLAIEKKAILVLSSLGDALLKKLIAY